MPQVRVQNADKVPGEVRGHDQGGIVFAADALGDLQMHGPYRRVPADG